MTDRTRPPWADLPHAAAITALLDELRTLSPDEARAIDTAWGAVPEAAWRVAGSAAEGVARRSAARGVPLDAVLALVVADLVGQHGLTSEHLYVLTAPARVVPRLSAIIDRALPTTTKENYDE